MLHLCLELLYPHVFLLERRNTRMLRNVAMLLVMVPLLFVSACGTGPDTEPIPAYPDAEVANEGNPVVDAVREGFAQAQQDAGFEVESEVYTVPNGTEFSEVEGFYEEELADRGWTASNEVPNIPTGSMAAWEHGRNQAFIIIMMEDPLEGQSLLMTMEATR
jgi:hypothetical protein